MVGVVGSHGAPRSQAAHRLTSARLHADVVIAGAGPAGSVSALLLARAGFDVLLLDRARFPRPKPCGDCLSAQAALLLGRLGLLDAVLELQPARLQGWRIRGVHGRGFDARFDELPDSPLDGCALALPRARLDEVLLHAAAAAGARVLTGTHVEDVLRDARGVCGLRARAGQDALDVTAHLTIGADGLRSRVARALGAVARPARLRKLSLTAHLELERPLEPWGEMHSLDGVCVGIAPVTAGGRHCNVTVVADVGRFAPRVRLNSRAFVDDALHRARPDLGARLEPDTPLLASGPFDMPVRRCVTDGAALVGDAAGYFDPFTGQGVYQAIASAELLAHTIAARGRTAARVRAAELAAYARGRGRLLTGARRVQQLIELVLARPVLAQYALDAIARRPTLGRALLGVTGDVLPPRALLSPRVLGSLLRPAAQPEP